MKTGHSTVGFQPRNRADHDGALQVRDDANLILCIRLQKCLVILAAVKHTDD